MAKFAYIALVIALATPSLAHAAWWNPSTWNIFKKSEVAIPSPEPSQPGDSEATTTDIVVATPTVDDLYRRIAELETKLEEAQLKLRAAGVKDDTEKKEPVPAKPAPIAQASGSDVAAKIRPSIVLVETSNGFAGGTIIDKGGKILTSAHALWTKDSSGAVTGANEKATVTLSNGSKKTAALVGLDEAHDLAIVALSSGSYPYLNVAYDSGIKQGDALFVAGAPSGREGSSGGSSFVAASVAGVASGQIEMISAEKPLDTGGAVVNSRGELVGVPDKSTCKVLEDMTTCLKYSIVTKSMKSVVPKLAEGMRLYKDKKTRTAAEELVRGQLDGLYAGVSDNNAINYAYEVATGKNSFDNLNSRLAEDSDGKVTKIYLTKLKIAAQALYGAMDSLKSQFHAMNVFVEDQEKALGTLGDYQKKTMDELSADSKLKEGQFAAKVSLWSRKKNEYDAYITNSSNVSYEYLMEEGAAIEDEVDYLSKAKKEILDEYSGENADIF